jgi:hypothetical protein
MEYYFCLLTAEEAKDPIKLGWAYTKTKESEWLLCSETENYMTGVVKGIDFIIHDGKSYMILKRFCDIDSKKIVALCQESSFGCDIRKF